MLQFIVIALGFYIVYLLESLHSESAKKRHLEKEVARLTEEVVKYKGYEYNYNSLKKSYLDLLDKALKKRKKDE